MREPVRMMGEFMQPGGRLLLSKLGLEGLSPLQYFHLRHSVLVSLLKIHVFLYLDCLEGIDEQIATGLAVYKDGQKALVSFPEDNDFPYEPTGRAFYNSRFVQRLRQKASSLPTYVSIFTIFLLPR